MSIRNSKLKIAAFVGGILILILAIWAISGKKEGNGAYDAFARCLREKGIVMYGANWCPHCQNEKRAFGSSFRFVNYVECPAEPKRCIEAGIEGYPTWVFPGGKRLEGEQGLLRLSKESGCELTTDKVND